MLLASALLMTAGAAHAQALPGHGIATHGDVDIVRHDAHAMSLLQNTPVAVIDWTSFDIGADAQVTVRAPTCDAMLLNRVVGSIPSVIAGSLQANGAVWLINPHGIQITGSGSIDAGAFLASTLDVDGNAFFRHVEDGSVPLREVGSLASVAQDGQINVTGMHRGLPGYAILMAANVSVSGTMLPVHAANGAALLRDPGGVLRIILSPPHAAVNGDATQPDLATPLSPRPGADASVDLDIDTDVAADVRDESPEIPLSPLVRRTPPPPPRAPGHALLALPPPLHLPPAALRTAAASPGGVSLLGGTFGARQSIPAAWQSAAPGFDGPTQAIIELPHLRPPR